jgi:hypothetical protein
MGRAVLVLLAAIAVAFIGAMTVSSQYNYCTVLTTEVSIWQHYFSLGFT